MYPTMELFVGFVEIS